MIRLRIVAMLVLGPAILLLLPAAALAQPAPVSTPRPPSEAKPISPGIALDLTPDTIPVNAVALLGVQVTNNTPDDATGIHVHSTLPAGVVLASDPVSANTCDGTLTAGAGDSSFDLSGASLSRVSNCAFQIELKGTTAGHYSIPVAASSDQNAGPVDASYGLTVAAGPTLQSRVLSDHVAVGGKTTQSFHMANPNGTVTLTSVRMSERLPSGVVISTPSGLTGGCGGGSLAADDGGGSINLSGATLTAGESCDFAVDITPTTEGSKLIYCQATAMSNLLGGDCAFTINGAPGQAGTPPPTGTAASSADSARPNPIGGLLALAFGLATTIGIRKFRRAA